MTPAGASAKRVKFGLEKYKVILATFKCSTLCMNIVIRIADAFTVDLLLLLFEITQNLC